MKKFFRYIENCFAYMIFKHKMKVAIFDAFDHADEWVRFVTNFAVAYKDSSPEEIKKDFISALAGKVHESAQSEKKE